MEFLTTFKKGGQLWDLYICHPIDRYFVTVHGVETGKRPVTETAEGDFVFQTKNNHYARIPKRVLRSVGSVV